MAMPPVLVTGATGFFGGNLARELAARGQRVRVLCRGGRSPVALAGRDCDVVEGNLLDPATLARAVAGCRQVYHAAASVTFSARSASEAERVRRVNVEGTLALLRAAAAMGVERVVYVSTVDAIGLPPPGAIADEATDWTPGRIDTIYAITKREAEKAALEFPDVDVVAVCPTLMIGGYDPKPTSGRLLQPLLRSPVVVYPRGGGNNFVAVGDAVAGAIGAMASGRRGERYILGHANMTYRDFFTLGLGVLGRRALLVPAWRPAIVAAGRALEAAGWLSRREPLLTAELARLGFARHYYDSSKAIRELGLPQTPLADALSDAFAWLRRLG